MRCAGRDEVSGSTGLHPVVPGTFVMVANLSRDAQGGKWTKRSHRLVAAIPASGCSDPWRTQVFCYIMKIYLGFTVAGSRSSIEAAKKILTVLQSSGHEVLTSHLVGEDAWEADRSVSPQEIFARDMNWLAQCDVFVAEVTGSSFGLGFETGYLLGATTKKTVLFFERDAEHRISLLITGNTHPNCVLAPYSRLGELEELVQRCVSPIGSSGSSNLT
jgi:hypothetical protein